MAGNVTRLLAATNESIRQAAQCMEEVRRNAYLWDAVTHRQDYPGSAHRDTRAIYLRWAAEWTPACIFDTLSAEWCDAASIMAKTMGLVRSVLAEIEAKELGRAMIVSLRPGGIITPHCDEGAYARHFARYHVPLESASGNTFTVGGETVRMEVGELWTFRHDLEHTVRNDSELERVHLIVDACGQKRAT